MKRVLFAIVLVMAHVAGYAHEPIIIPTPRSVDVGEGNYTISPKTTISTYHEELQPLVDYCVAEIGLTKSTKYSDIKLVIDENLKQEEYRLFVLEDGITICGGGYGGVFNGVATLMQLLPADVYNGGLTRSVDIVCCEISDSPRFEHRGFMLDVCRAWMDKDKEPTCQCSRRKRQGFDPWVQKIPWRRAWEPTPVLFSGESHGQRSLEGYST